MKWKLKTKAELLLGETEKKLNHPLLTAVTLHNDIQAVFSDTNES